MLLCTLAVSGAARSAAQPATETALPVRQTTHVAANEDQLWLARFDGEVSALSYRGPSGEFVSGPPLKAVVASLAAVGSEAYVFLDDGSFYRFSQAEGPVGNPWKTAANLPGKQRALHLVGVDGTPYALVPSGVAAALPIVDRGPQPPTTRPFEPGEAPLSLVRYGSLGWTAVAPCPEVIRGDAPPGLRPRLCSLRQRVMLFWGTADAERISYFSFDMETGSWLMGGTLEIPGVTAFWVPVVNRLPTLVANVVGRDGVATLEIFRLIGDEGGAGRDKWLRSAMELSPLPDQATRTEPVEAVSFNQHLGLLVVGADGSAYLRFGRFDGASAMPTHDVFAEPVRPVPGVDFHTLQAALVLAILVTLFAFRRGSIATAIPLPPGWTPALSLQRLLGCAIDLLPFSVVFALVLGVDWPNGLRQLVDWAFGPQVGESALPEGPVLTWWLLSAGAYTGYSLLLELLTGRTVGKVLLRTRLLSRTGVRPSVWQILLRNIFRFLEVLPPFWILGFLVVLSRNRQRVGDIFAHTLSVRRIQAPSDERKSDDSADTKGD